MAEQNEIEVKNIKRLLPKADKKQPVTLENEIEAGQLRRLEFDEQFRSSKRLGVTVFILVFVVFGLWSVTMPIDSAAHALGVVTVKSFKKPVQYLEGGIVKEVKVHEGDVVKEGDVVVVVDDTNAKAQLGSLSAVLKSRLAQEARLIAERDGKDSVAYPNELVRDTEAQREIRDQDQLFKTRRVSLASDKQAYQQSVDQLLARVKGLEAQHESLTKLVAMRTNDVNDFQSLLKDGFTEKTRLHELERDLTSMQGQLAQVDSDIAGTNFQVTQARIQVAQLQNKFQTDVATQLSDTQTQIKDLRERITALDSAVERTEVRSPDNGVIYNLKVHTRGTVIPAGAVLAEIVPQKDILIIEAKVSPMDINNISIGQSAKIQFPALSSSRRRAPKLDATVSVVSADAIFEASGASYYLARLDLAPDSEKELDGATLVPGMQADVLINTGSRTFLQYLMKPLTDAFSHSVREQ